MAKKRQQRHRSPRKEYTIGIVRSRDNVGKNWVIFVRAFYREEGESEITLAGTVRITDPETADREEHYSFNSTGGSFLRCYSEKERKIVVSLISVQHGGKTIETGRSVEIMLPAEPHDSLRQTHKTIPDVGFWGNVFRRLL